MGTTVPLIYDVLNKDYTAVGISFDSLKQLDAIGLISFESLAGYQLLGFQKQIVTRYFAESFVLEFNNPSQNNLDIGKVMLSKAGQELASICGPKPRSEFRDYIVNKWNSSGFKVTAANQI